jgi:dienelactone hydrolase
MQDSSLHPGVDGRLTDMWLARHTPENTMPIIENALKAIKEQYGDKEYRTSHGIHVVGYCFGGKYALRLAATEGVSATAVAHGSDSYQVSIYLVLTNLPQER